MSPNPRGLTNASANDFILSNFPEQGNELVGRLWKMLAIKMNAILYFRRVFVIVFRISCTVCFLWLVPSLNVLGTEKFICARLGVSRTIYVNVDTPSLAFPYFNVLGGAPVTKKHNVLYHQFHPHLWLFCARLSVKILSVSWVTFLCLCFVIFILLSVCSGIFPVICILYPPYQFVNILFSSAWECSMFFHIFMIIGPPRFPFTVFGQLNLLYIPLAQPTLFDHFQN